ncbi:hypothetical protein IAR55_006939 [Kwoniella newhampshirensis]|uniref:Glutamate-1-semialdehyde 2,1-aminomutase n=1 Tax=Kwoniella newhampshirensis TaxID=1651941 RepID=A0AAW0YGV7_9TREE
MTYTTLASALWEAERSYASKNPKSAQAYGQATDHLPGGSTRSSIFVHPFPLFIEKGEGGELTDVDGHVYMDFVSDFTSGIYGKTHPLIRSAIISALDNGLQLGAHSTSESHLASLLCARFPSIDLIRFANSGTEANILAITAALRHTGKRKVVVFEDGYHGSVLSHFELSGSNWGGTHDMKVPFDYLVCPYNDIAGSDRVIQAHSDEIGAILVEPMLGAGGCIPGDIDFLQYLRTKATDIGAALIFDEVQTARLSTGGRQKTLDIVPDMTTLGKFFGGGFAFGAFGGNRSIMQMFDARSSGAISHGGTFNNSPLTMAAGAVAVEKILTEEALADLNQLGDWMRDSLNEAFESKSLPFKMTGLGSINQVHCTLSKDSRTTGLSLLFHKLLGRGYWIAQRGLISLSFAMTRKDVEGFVNAVIGCAEEVGKLAR